MNGRGTVVLTGADGPVADAVELKLREKEWEVVRLARGDDLEEAVASASAVVVLDAARPFVNVADYLVVLGALADAVPGSAVERVVTVTQWGAGHEIEQFREVMREAEQGFPDANTRLTPVRFGLLVGTPDQQGPNDGALFAALRARGGKPRPLYVPGSGEQKVRPLFVDDLAAIVSFALEGAVDDGPEILAEGSEELSVEDLVGRLNGDDVPIRQISRWHSVLFAVRPMLSIRMDVAKELLPERDMLLRPDPPPKALLGVPVRPPAEVWTGHAVSQRALRGKRTRHARIYRLPPWSAFVSGVLVLLGAGALVVGLHDVLTVPTLGARLVSLGLLLAGAFAVVGGLGLYVTSWAPRYAVALLAGAVMFVAVIGLLAAALVNGDVEWWWMVWGYVAFFVFAACVLLWRRGGLAVADLMRTSVKVTGSLVAAGVVVGLLQFVYSSVYVPTVASPAVNADVRLEPGPMVRGLRTVDVVLRMKNVSSQAVNLLGGTYALDGSRVRPSQRPSGGEIGRLARWESELRAGVPIESAAERVAWARLDRGPVVEAGVFLEPDEEMERRFVAHVPRRVEVLTARVSLALARRRFRGFETPTVSVRSTEGGAVADYVGEIDDPSLLHKLIRTPRYVHMAHALDGTVPSRCGPALMVAYIDDKPVTNLTEAGCSDFERRKAEHYGVVFSGAGTEVHLPACRPKRTTADRS
jgi:hypothetical protein